MNRVPKDGRITGQGPRRRAEAVNHADDFVILGRGQAAEALAWTRPVMTRLGLTRLGLTPNEAKTSVARLKPKARGARPAVQRAPRLVARLRLRPVHLGPPPRASG